MYTRGPWKGPQAGEAISLIFEGNRDRRRREMGRIDASGSPPYKPHATANGDRTREADLSTQQAGAEAPSWISPPPEDQRRPQGAGRPARARAQAAQRLTPAPTTALAKGRIRDVPEDVPCSGSGNAQTSWPPRPAAEPPSADSCCKR